MPDKPEDPTATEEIMWATFHALRTHGYSNTSISKIADEFPKSKSLLYYHYDDKEDLLADFLAYLLDRLEADLADLNRDDPEVHLDGLLDLLVPREMDEDEFGFRRAILEIRSQAPYRDSYRAQFERSDELFRSELVTAIEHGIDDGTFRPVDADAVSDFIYSVAYGAMERGLTTDDPALFERNRTTLEAYIEANLRADDQ